MEQTYWTVKDEDGIIQPIWIITTENYDELLKKDYNKQSVEDWLSKPRNKGCSLVKIVIREVKQ